MGKKLTTPILFLIFNRPDTTQQVFSEIRRAKPTKLFVAGDGPREDKENEKEKCRAARDILNGIDWDCQVKTLVRKRNLGCKMAVSSAIDWFFENVEEGIILEDDCLPHPTFFRFCQELLKKYRDDERTMVISGDNFLLGHKRTDYSYYFSRYNHIWGWATWRRAWLHYDGDIRMWPGIRDESWLKDILGDSKTVRYWSNVFRLVYENKIDTWDYPWTFSCWMQNGLAIIPSVNLVSNIGFGPESTHTKGKSKFANMAVADMDFPLRHPPFIIRDTKADDFVQKTHFDIPNILLRIVKRLSIKEKNILEKERHESIRQNCERNI